MAQIKSNNILGKPQVYNNLEFILDGNEDENLKITKFFHLIMVNQQKRFNIQLSEGEILYFFRRLCFILKEQDNKNLIQQLQIIINK